MDIVFTMLVLGACVFAVVWLSPGMLIWVAAVTLARREALHTQRLAKARFLAQFEGEPDHLQVVAGLRTRPNRV
jgi:hypothetical protein